MVTNEDEALMDRLIKEHIYEDYCEAELKAEKEDEVILELNG